MTSEFQQLNTEYQDLTGQDLFLYASEKSPGRTMYVFTDRNMFHRGNALEFMRLKVNGAREAVRLAACEYEPGEFTHPMHTDPLCAHCNRPKNAHNQ